MLVIAADSGGGPRPRELTPFFRIVQRRSGWARKIGFEHNKIHHVARSSRAPCKGAPPCTSTARATAVGKV